MDCERHPVNNLQEDDRLIGGGKYSAHLISCLSHHLLRGQVKPVLTYFESLVCHPSAPLPDPVTACISAKCTFIPLWLLEGPATLLARTGSPPGNVTFYLFHRLTPVRLAHQNTLSRVLSILGILELPAQNPAVAHVSKHLWARLSSQDWHSLAVHTPAAVLGGWA